MADYTTATTADEIIDAIEEIADELGARAGQWDLELAAADLLDATEGRTTHPDAREAHEALTMYAEGGEALIGGRDVIRALDAWA